jgi:hypothetical protein
MDYGCRAGRAVAAHPNGERKPHRAAEINVPDRLILVPSQPQLNDPAAGAL